MDSFGRKDCALYIYIVSQLLYIITFQNNALLFQMDLDSIVVQLLYIWAITLMLSQNQ